MPRWPTRCRGGVVALATLVLAGCTQGGLDPQGREADRIFDITVWLTIAGTIVSLIVIGAWVVAVVRRGRDDQPRTEEVADSKLERNFIIGGGIVMPAIVLAGFFGVQIWSTIQQPQDGQIRIDAVGHRFWWEATYRNIEGVEEFTTANQFHIPVDTEITVLLTTDDVIHSFWVPNLAGKLDMTPGRINRFVFEANEPGVYPGYCAEYCGLQHAWMKFEVVAMEPDEFQTWARQMAQPAPEPEGDLEARGKEVFLEQSCVGCHVIRGVAEIGQVGPPLTHLASRTEIGAGILPLTEDNLTAWIANAQAIKPGIQMPPQELTEEELNALVAYLMSLE